MNKSVRTSRSNWNSSWVGALYMLNWLKISMSGHQRKVYTSLQFKRSTQRFLGQFCSWAKNKVKMPQSCVISQNSARKIGSGCFLMMPRQRVCMCWKSFGSICSLRSLRMPSASQTLMLSTRKCLSRTWWTRWFSCRRDDQLPNLKWCSKMHTYKRLLKSHWPCSGCLPRSRVSLPNSLTTTHTNCLWWLRCPIYAWPAKSENKLRTTRRSSLRWQSTSVETRSPAMSSATSHSCCLIFASTVKAFSALYFLSASTKLSVLLLIKGLNMSRTSNRISNWMTKFPTNRSSNCFSSLTLTSRNSLSWLKCAWLHSQRFHGC